MIYNQLLLLSPLTVVGVSVPIPTPLSLSPSTIPSLLFSHAQMQLSSSCGPSWNLYLSPFEQKCYQIEWGWLEFQTRIYPSIVQHKNWIVINNCIQPMRAMANIVASWNAFCNDSCNNWSIWQSTDAVASSRMRSLFLWIVSSSCRWLTEQLEPSSVVSIPSGKSSITWSKCSPPSKYPHPNGYQTQVQILSNQTSTE